MEVLFILVPITIVIGGGFVGMFIFSVYYGQFEEMESPSSRILFEDSLNKSGNLKK